jgi:hypothetical protein
LLERGSTAPKICKHRTSGRRATRDYS